MTVILRHLEQNILQSTRSITKRSERSKKIPKQVRNDTNPTVVLNLFQHLFVKSFRNYLGLLFHTTQSLILFALQISFAMLRATSSFGLRPHALSQNNT